MTVVGGAIAAPTIISPDRADNMLEITKAGGISFAAAHIRSQRSLEDVDN